MSKKLSGWLFNGVPVEEVKTFVPKKPKIKLVLSKNRIHCAPYVKHFFWQPSNINNFLEGAITYDIMTFQHVLTYAEVVKLMKPALYRAEGFI